MAGGFPVPDLDQSLAQTVSIELTDGTVWRGVGPATLDGKTITIKRILVTEPYELPFDCHWGVVAVEAGDDT
jgi:hypothetical protein